jgi:hypothetical protein
VTLKIILCQMFGESIGDLILGIDREDFVPRAKLGKPCQFEGTRVVFKNLALHIRFSAKNLEILLPHFLHNPTIGMMSLRACDIAMYSALVVESALKFGGPRDTRATTS